jgi:hypothetical protein
MDKADKRRLAGLPAARSSGGRVWDRFAKAVVDHYGGLCHLCLATMAGRSRRTISSP